MMLKQILVLSIILVSLPGIILATTFQIPSDHPNIQAGVDAAATGDTVLLDPGLYFGVGNRDIDFHGKDITVRSTDDNPATCIIACQGYEGNSHRGFIFQSGESSAAQIRGITITGGWVDDGTYDPNIAGGGGAVLCSNNSSPTFINCRLTNNTSLHHGGGLAAIQASPTLTNCRLDNNLSGYNGGGAFFSGNCTATFSGCQVDNNTTLSEGGGLYLNCQSPLIYQCVIVQNNHTGLQSTGDITILDTTLAFNDFGVSIYENGTVENSLIVFNSVAFDNYLAYSLEFGSAAITCSNVFGNELISNYDTYQYEPGYQGNISSDPQFCDIDNWDYHLAPGSPSLDSACGLIGALGVGLCSQISPVVELADRTFGIRDNFPNPFNPRTTIRFVLDQEYRIQLEIVDLAGRRIKSLIRAEHFQAGEHTQIWNGRDDSERMVAAGVYFAVLTTPDRIDSQRMVLLK